MTMIKALFYLMAIIALGSAVFVATTKNLVRCIFMFFITLFALAGLYVLALADFVAVTQVVIYVGGILVLILFAFMLSGKETLNAAMQQRNEFISLRNLPAFLLAAVFLIVILNLILKANVGNLDWIANSISANNVVAANDLMTENIGVNLMTRYLLPFEAVSVLLMVALIGAAHLSRKGGSA